MFAVFLFSLPVYFLVLWPWWRHIY